jgi:hypothetical protein
VRGSVDEELESTEERVTLKNDRKWKAWKPLAFAALGVVAIASPSAAAAAVSSVTTVQASPSTALTGQSVALSAIVTCAGDPSGGLGVTFFDGGNLLATVPVGAGGASAYATTFTSPGAHTITAAYNGNDNCTASNGTTTVQVTAAPTPSVSSPLCVLLCNSPVNVSVDLLGGLLRNI